MRSRMRQRQKMWFVSVGEKAVGLDRVQIFGKPVLKRFFISETHNLPLHYGSGIVEQYGRYIFCYNQEDIPVEGTQVYIDRTPELDGDGNLIVDEIGSPTVLPDYIVVRTISSKRGDVYSIGVKKITDKEDFMP